jgi:hypothetical protein
MYTTDIDTVPVQEDGLPHLDSGARDEARRMVVGIKKYFGDYIHPAVRIKIKSNPHDFGAYLSIELSCSELNDDACDSICLIENNMPETWAELESETYTEKEILHDE